jgi:hypothetical protein
VLVNQLATPGMGSLMGGHIIAGIGQLLLAIAGFAMVTTWLVMRIVQQVRELTEDFVPAASPHAWLGKVGGLLFAAAWLWSLVTSWQILHSSAPAETDGVPPRLQ